MSLLTLVTRSVSSVRVGAFGWLNHVCSRNFASSQLQQSDVPVKYRHTYDRGVGILRESKLNKGQAFTLAERQLLGLQGLLPPRLMTFDEQVYQVLENFHHFKEDLNKYTYLINLMEINERLFFRAVTENVEEMMPVIYTPTVGEACQKYGLVFRRPRGLFISIHDKGNIHQVLGNWPEKDVRAIVVTDAERILGLGDLGANGMGIPVGKLSLYTALGGVKPKWCLPICLDVGTNNEQLLQDPLYIGHQHKRISGEQYDEFIDEFMMQVVRKYGQEVLIQFEDFANHNAFRFLKKYRDKYCVFNDDIQGTAAVAVAGVLASLRITGKPLKDNVFLFQGAGEASIGIAHLLVRAMVKEGVAEEEAYKKMYLKDSRGLIVKDRPQGGLTGEKAQFTQDAPPLVDLQEIVDFVKPTALIGAAAVPNVFTPDIIKSMANCNERPIIFALSNPTSMAECTAEEAYVHSGGRAVYASGSPFPAVTYEGKTLYPGQGNNAYIFPGVALGVILSGIRHISDDVFLESAKILSHLVSESDLAEGRVYPPLSSIRDVSASMAAQLMQYAYDESIACTYPEPKDKQAYVRKHSYNVRSYDSFMPNMYTYPSDIMPKDD